MIPKTVHYVWLGRKPKPLQARMCINSWKRWLPDYNIVEWNEDNLDLTEIARSNHFFSECMRLGLWAFASDYLRLYVLLEHGGVYLDTDVEVVRSFDQFLEDEVFVGEEDNGFICTGVIGAEQGSSCIARLLRFYDEEIWESDISNNPIIFRRLMEREPEAFSACHIYPKEVFSPYSPSEEFSIPVEGNFTAAVHWYAADWNMSRRGYVFLNTKHIKSPVIRSLAKVKKSIGYWFRAQWK